MPLQNIDYGKRIPSVEEIKERMRLKAAGLPVVTQTQVQEAEAKAAEAEREREAAKQALQKIRRSPKGIQATVRELMEEHGVNPVEELVLMIKEGELDTDIGLKTKVLMGLAEFVTPKMKSVEVQGQVDHTITVKINRFGSQENPVIPVKAVTEVANA